jgi:glycosyltransferase involved in cell wall biosynthesis
VPKELLITVLLATYNSAEFIAQSIRSVLIQTYHNFELLIVDDGSTDNTEIIVNSFKDERINYVKKEHTGLADSLNFGLKIAKYDWIARMDADDICHSERLKTLLTADFSNANNIIFSKGAFFSKSTLRIIQECPNNQREIIKSLALHSLIMHPSVIYNRHFILESGGYNENLQIYEDYDLWLRISKKCNFILIPEVLYYLRLREGSLTSNKYFTRQTIYNIQKPYYLNLKESFGIADKEEIIKLNGWREYFFGNKKEARIHWRKLKFIDMGIRVLVASAFTFLPQKIFAYFINKGLRPKFSFIFKRYFNKGIKKTINDFNNQIRLLSSV